MSLKQTRVVLATVIASILTAVIAVASTGGSAAASGSSEGVYGKGAEKIAPWVLEQTASGGTAEYLVVLTEQADLSAARTLPSKREKGRYVRDRLWETAQRTQAPLLQWLRAAGAPHRSYYIVNLILVEGDLALARQLAARPDVARIEGNPQIDNRPLLATAAPQVPGEPDAPETGVSWVNAPDAWDLGFSGQGLVIGAADTGYDWDHVAVKSQYRGWDGATEDHDYSWHDAVHSGGGSCGAQSDEPCDDYGHGTHTIGTVLGDDGAGNQIGVAPGARWIGCRNMNVGYGSPARYLECFEFFLAPYPVDGTPAEGISYLAPDLTTNSWGCPASEGCSWDTLQAAVQAQMAAGIVTVSSAGNDGSSCSSVSSPVAIYGETLTVGALSSGSDTIASLSSRGPVTVDGSNRIKPDISAPGISVRSCLNGGGYGSMSGTSMACPHVAGGMAVMLAAFPQLIGNVYYAEQRLTFSAHRISTSSCSSIAGVYPNNVYGWGRLDLACAVPGVVSLSGPAALCAGQSTILQVDLAGSGPWDVTWSDSYTQTAVMTSPATRTVLPAVSTTYQVTSVAFDSCSQSAAGSAVVTVWDALSLVTIVADGSTTVCRTCLGGTADLTDTGGGDSSHQWGYRLASGGAVTAIAGQVGTSYQINGADFPAPGDYYLVVETTPTCGSALLSNEVPVTVLEIPVELQRFVIE